MRQPVGLSVRPLAAAILTAACFLSPPAANAQAQSQAQSPSTGSADGTATVPDQKLDAAVAAIKQVSSIKENYKQRMEAAAPSDRERIADEANNALVKAVTDQGLSVQEYNSILMTAQNNPEVYEKLVRRIGPSGN
jgi:Domain of unknown function (DUF4168)